jgi:BlaI family penicillinase repressor
MAYATIGSIMSGNIKERHDPGTLGELERAILELIWEHEVQSAEQVRECLKVHGRPLKESTIRTVLHRLEKKGYLRHFIENRTFLYTAAKSREAVAGRAVQRIVEWFCEGSVETLLVGMVDSAILDRKDLRRLVDRIAAAKRGTKS